LPYIAQEARDKYTPVIKDLLRIVRNAPPGELTFVLTVITKAWLDSLAPVGYTEMAMAVGILETAKHELMRRCLDPYETGKAAKNGDVFTPFPQELEMK
jgi:hypothetical protein